MPHMVMTASKGDTFPNADPPIPRFWAMPGVHSAECLRGNWVPTIDFVP
jgi:hypothetical protein